MGCCKSSERKLYNDKSLYLENRNISNKQVNLTFEETEKNKINPKLPEGRK